MPEQTKVKNEKGETLKAGCVVLNNNNEVLLVVEMDVVKAVNAWMFPKGHVDPGETLEQTALRETKEETGYDVEVIKRLPDVTYTHGKTGELIRVAFFLTKPLGKSGAPEESVQSKWFTMSEAREALAPNLVILLDRII